jgi:hypothetical protein
LAAALSACSTNALLKRRVAVQFFHRQRTDVDDPSENFNWIGARIPTPTSRVRALDPLKPLEPLEPIELVEPIEPFEPLEPLDTLTDRFGRIYTAKN